MATKVITNYIYKMVESFKGVSKVLLRLLVLYTSWYIVKRTDYWKKILHYIAVTLCNKNARLPYFLQEITKIPLLSYDFGY